MSSCMIYIEVNVTYRNFPYRYRPIGEYNLLIYSLNKNIWHCQAIESSLIKLFRHTIFVCIFSAYESRCTQNTNKICIELTLSADLWFLFVL